MSKQLERLVVYPGLFKLRLEFKDEMWPAIHEYKDSLYAASVIAELKKTYDEFEVYDIVMDVTYKAGRNIK